MGKLKLILVFAIVVTVVVVVAAAGMLYVRSLDDAEKADIAALTRADRKQRDPSLARGDRPAPGAYTYHGSGSERTDALGGSQHAYPEQIAGLVQLLDDHPCHWTMSFVFLKGRKLGDNLCSRPTELREIGFASWVTFFGATRTDVFECERGTLRWRADDAGGATRRSTCRTTNSVADRTLRVIGREPVRVAGRDVEAVHVRIESTFSGGVRGAGVIEYWVSTPTGLPLRLHSSSDYESDSGSYDEQFDYVLTSLEPA